MLQLLRTTIPITDHVISLKSIFSRTTKSISKARASGDGNTDAVFKRQHTKSKLDNICFEETFSAILLTQIRVKIYDREVLILWSNHNSIEYPESSVWSVWIWIHWWLKYMYVNSGGWLLRVSQLAILCRTPLPFTLNPMLFFSPYSPYFSFQIFKI